MNNGDRLSELNEQIPQVFGKAIEKVKIEDLPGIIKALSQVGSETERAIYTEQLAKKFKISPGKIAKDIKILIRSQNKKEVTANFPDLVDIAINSSEEVVFLLGGLDITTEKEVEIDGKIYIPPRKEDIPFSLPRAEYVFSHYRRYYENAESDSALYHDLLTYFRRFSFLRENELQIIALYVFLTYIQDHKDIHYLAVILFYAVPERGKTRTGKAFTYVARRGIHQVDLREANLFRYSQNLQATLFLDIKNLWKKAERSGSEDILLLRYERGASVSRVLYPEKGPFEDMKHFSISGPTIVATNEPVHKILDSRSLLINMENRPGVYEDPTPDKAQELKERLTAWRARASLEPLPDIKHIPELNGRLWDISKPLLQICRLVYPEGLAELQEVLKGIADQRIEDKKESIEGQIVETLYELSPETENIFEWTIKTQEVLDSLNKNRPEAYKLSPQYLGKKLNAMGIRTRKVQGYSEVILKKANYDLLCVQYGVTEKNDTPPPEKTLLNSTIPKNQGISTICTGRELVESQGNSTQTLPTESLDNKGFESEVENGREFPGGREEIILEGEL
jgi:hypothetical protein